MNTQLIIDIAADGTTQYLAKDSSGNISNELPPEFSIQFGAAQQSQITKLSQIRVDLATERDSLLIDKSNLTKQLAAANAKIEALQSGVPSVNPILGDGVTITAEQHLDAVGLGGNRQPTLLYLRQAGAVSAKLDATEAFLNTVLAMFAQDPSPRSDWPAAPHSFEDVVGQAVSSLNPES